MKLTKRNIFGIILMTILILLMIFFISDWIISLLDTFLLLFELIKLTEMPHKMYGLIFMVTISWYILNSVISIWIRVMEKSLDLIKQKKEKK